MSALEKLHIPLDDAELLFEGFPTLSVLIQADKRLLEERSPVDIRTINVVHSFFNSQSNAKSESNRRNSSI